jgi:hypothetical protein
LEEEVELKEIGNEFDSKGKIKDYYFIFEYLD